MSEGQVRKRRWLPRREYREKVRAMVELIDLKPESMTTFEMIRQRDETGFSLKSNDNDEGIVLEGVIFTDGTVSIHWRSKFWSVVFYPDWSTFVNVHIGSHPTNGTIIRFHKQRFMGDDIVWKQEDANRSTPVVPPDDQHYVPEYGV